MPPHPPLALWAASLPFITGSESSTVFPLSSPGANYTTYTVALRHSVYDDNFVQVKELLSEYCKQLDLGTAISVFSSILQTSGHCTPHGGCSSSFASQGELLGDMGVGWADPWKCLNFPALA